MKKMRDRLQPGRISPEGLAFIVMISEIEAAALWEPVKPGVRIRDANPLVVDLAPVPDNGRVLSQAVDARRQRNARILGEAAPEYGHQQRLQRRVGAEHGLLPGGVLEWIPPANPMGQVIRPR